MRVFLFIWLFLWIGESHKMNSFKFWTRIDEEWLLVKVFFGLHFLASQMSMILMSCEWTTGFSYIFSDEITNLQMNAANGKRCPPLYEPKNTSIVWMNRNPLITVRAIYYFQWFRFRFGSHHDEDLIFQALSISAFVQHQ